MKKVLTLVVLAAVIVTTIVFNVKTVIQNKNNTAAAVDIKKASTGDGHYIDPSDAEYMGQRGVGCMHVNACDYNPEAKKQGDQCIFAWFVDNTKKVTTPRTEAYIFPEIKKNMVCSVRNKCTEALLIKAKIVHYDEAGNQDGTTEFSPIMHAFVSPANMKRYKGSNACYAYRQMSEDDFLNAVVPDVNPKAKK